MTQPENLGSFSPNRVPVAIRPNYMISYERGPVCIYVHADVFGWNKRVKAEFTRDIDILQALLGEPVYVAGRGGGDLKLAKFLDLFGFLFCGSVISDETQNAVPIFCRPLPGKPILIFQH